MSDSTLITDHEARALARVIEQFKDADNFQALISACCEPVQDAENTLEQLRSDRSISTAEGVQLDDLGALVGQPREGRSDTDYRLWISARVLANRSTGTGDDSLQIAALIAPGSPAAVVEYLPGSYAVLLTALVSDPDQVWRILQQIKPAGIGFWLEYSPWAADTLFTLAPDDVPELLSTTLGLAPDDGSTGGQLTDVIG